MSGIKFGGQQGHHNGGGSPLEDSKFVLMLEPEWGTLFGIRAAPCLFGHGVLWLGQWKALVWEVRRKV